MEPAGNINQIKTELLEGENTEIPLNGISSDLILRIKTTSNNPLTTTVEKKRRKNSSRKYEILRSRGKGNNNRGSDKITRASSNINGSLVSLSSGSKTEFLSEKEKKSGSDADQNTELVDSKGITLEPASEWVTENLINPKRTALQKQDLKSIRQAYVQYDTFCKQFFPFNQSADLTPHESKQLHTLTQQLIDSLNQLLVDIDEPQTLKISNTRKKTTEIYFLSNRNSFNQIEAMKIRSLLNKKITLNNPISLKDDIQKFNRFINRPKTSFENLLYRNIQQAVCKEDLKEEVAARQEKLSLLFSYQQAIMMLCQKISKRTPDFPVYSTSSEEMSVNTESINKLVNEIDNIIGKNINCKILQKEISDEIITKYLEGHLEKHLEIEASELVQAYEKKVNVNVLYPRTCEEIYNLFFNLKMQNPSPNDWFRAIFGRFITFLSADDTELLKPFTEPKDKKLHSAAVRNYLLDFQKVVSKQVFKDESLLVNLCGLIKQEVEGIESASNEIEASQEEGVEHEKELQTQARIFKMLGELMQDEKEMKRLIAKIDQELKKTNPKSMKKFNGSILIDTLFKFYRAPSQAFIWGPTATLCDVYKTLFKQDWLIIANLQNWNHDQTQKIQFKFNKHDMAFKFLKRGYVASQMCLFTQDLTIKIPLPGGEELKDPVSIEFYYQLIGELTPEEERDVKGALKRIAFTLKALGFPPLRRIIAPKMIIG